MALVDSGSNTILDSKLVPNNYHTDLPEHEQYYAEQIDGKLHKYTKKLVKYKLAFNLNNQLTNYIPVNATISLRDMIHTRIKFVIGLNILVNWYYGCIITPYGIQLGSYLTNHPLHIRVCCKAWWDTQRNN